MKDFIIQASWAVVAILSAYFWSLVWDLASDVGLFSLTGLGCFVISFVPLTGMVVGFRRAYPEGIWGIK